MKISTMESVSPNIFVRNLPETVSFYEMLGFQITVTVPEEAPFDFAMMQCGNVNFLFQTFASLGDDLPVISRNNGGSLLLYLQIKGIRDYFAVLEGKVTIVKPLETTFYGATEFSILDNNGYLLTFAEDE
jgi:uncharacterized glyoxalase superfamily protein PhnB